MQYQLELHSGIVRMREGFLYSDAATNAAMFQGMASATQPRATLRVPQKRWIYCYRKQTKYETKVQTNFELLAMI